MTTPLVEAIARTLWEAREVGFPAHVRMTWDSGSQAARERHLHTVRLFVHALRSEGLAIVPVEPTEAMEEAARDVPFIAMGNGEYLEPDRIDIYRAMVNAAQGGGE